MSEFIVALRSVFEWVGEFESSIALRESQYLFPWQMGGMMLSAISGLILVFANPMNYFANVIFWTKMLAMGIAGLNALAFHFITEYSLVDWDADVTPPF